MGRGGRRSGTPGKGYSNRTDLAQNRAPQQGQVTAATGGQTHNVSPVPPPPAPSAPAGMTPDDTPNLFDPGTVGRPIQDGLASGPGMGAPQPPAADEAAIIAAYLPALQQVALRPGTPTSFKALVRYLQGQ